MYIHHIDLYFTHMTTFRKQTVQKKGFKKTRSHVKVYPFWLLSEIYISHDEDNIIHESSHTSVL